MVLGVIEDRRAMFVDDFGLGMQLNGALDWRRTSGSVRIGERQGIGGYDFGNVASSFEVLFGLMNCRTRMMV
jgi:hypothetical protein